MAYVIGVGDFIELQNVYQFNAQTFRNVWHFKVTGGPTQTNGASWLQGVLGYWETSFWTPLRELLSNELALVWMTAQVVQPFRYRVERLAPGSPSGAVAEPAVPPSSTVNVQRWAQRAGRPYVGRVYIPGLPAVDQTLGQLTEGAYSTWKDNLPIFLLAPTVSGTQLQQYLNTTGVDVNLQQVFGAAVDRTLRSQRRREIGVGE